MGEALTGVRAGQVLSREKTVLWDADTVRLGGRHYLGLASARDAESPTWSKTLSMYGNTPRENREISDLPRRNGRVGRIGKAEDARR